MAAGYQRRRLADSCSWTILVLVFVLVAANISEANLSLMYRTRIQGPSSDFKQHRIVRPRIYHARNKREVTSTRESDIDHINIVSVSLELNGVNRILDLRLNRDLIPTGYKERFQHRGDFKTHVPTKVELCHYQGSIRELPGSWVAVSTCRGLKGVIFDGKNLHHIQPEEESLQSIHYMYQHSDLVANSTCGYEGTPHDVAKEFTVLNKFNKISRHKRATETIRGPYNANRQSRYVELVLVIDKNEYTSLDQNLTKVHHHCKDIANIINALYAPLNIFIALVGVEVWTDADEIHLLSSGDKTLTNFLQYRKERLVKSIPNDNAQLLTKMQFDDGVVGKALKGPICTYEFSGGVSVDHSNVVGLVAATVAHEMGHNFGMEHDSSDCLCPEERCIMAPSSGSSGPIHWSSCSLEYLALAFEHGMDYCLRNKPRRLFDSPICGNGFVEPGEQCDCGLVDNCDNPCCNVSTCMLHGNASCATGECCDLSTCKPKAAGTECRSAEQECDLPEYCTGQSEYCPTDVFKIDGEACSMGKAYCYQGNCRTHNDQCKLLWGPTGSSSDSLCYEMNDQGTKTGNCGYNRTGNNYVKCHDKNILCGMLHCKHLNERLEFGMESVAILSHSFLNSQGNIIACRSAMVDLGLNQVDPGLAPDGARCAQGKMCVNQKCIAVAELRTSFPSGRACPNNCGGNGVCNSLGHCHCNRGFQPPDCSQPGVGGSEDSGPAEDPNARSEYIMSLYIIFLGIVPIISLVSFGVWYARNNGAGVKQWKKTTSGSSGPISTLSRGFGFGFGGPVLPNHQQQSRPFSSGDAIHPPTIKTIERSSSTNHGINNIDSNLPATPHQDPACASLLPKTDPDKRFNNNFFGQFKGFSITPLTQAGSESNPSELSPWSLDEPTTVAIKTNPGPARRSVAPPALPPPNVGSNARPLISSPVLAATTCTSVELDAPPCIPTRPAPDVPTDVPALTPKAPNSGGSALMRIASKLYPNSGSSKAVEVAARFGGNSTLPRSHRHKPAPKSFDKEILRNLEISNPIPQKEIEIPGAAIAVKPEPESGPERRAVLTRAQSMRDSKVTPRPTISRCDSMRHPNSGQRPTSVPMSIRPTSPPPVPPVLKNPKSTSESQKKTRVDDTYDDCMNLVADTSLGKIVEESPSNDNIYAVIEESVPEKLNAKWSGATESEYKTPKSVEVASTDSMGLLSEIVSEISNRNFDSIYSTRTLDSEPGQTKSKKDSGAYANSPTSLYSNTSTSSGCLLPSTIKMPVGKALKKLSEKRETTPVVKATAVAAPEKHQKSTRSETLLKDIKDIKLNSPDVVSSCSSGTSQTNKTPDVLGRDNNTKGFVNASMQIRQKSLTVPAKPSNISTKAQSFSDTNRALIMNGGSKTSARGQIKVTEPAAAAMTTATTNASIASTTPSKLEDKRVEIAVQKVTSGKSNVASLQQKFEQPEKNVTKSLKKLNAPGTFSATAKK